MPKRVFEKPSPVLRHNSRGVFFFAASNCNFRKKGFTAAPLSSSWNIYWLRFKNICVSHRAEAKETVTARGYVVLLNIESARNFYSKCINSVAQRCVKIVNSFAIPLDFTPPGSPSGRCQPCRLCISMLINIYKIRPFRFQYQGWGTKKKRGKKQTSFFRREHVLAFFSGIVMILIIHFFNINSFN